MKVTMFTDALHKQVQCQPMTYTSMCPPPSSVTSKSSPYCALLSNLPALLFHVNIVITFFIDISIPIDSPNMAFLQKAI